MDQQTNPVVVIGTHRSGTSVLAGCLRFLGINLGRNLIFDNISDQSQNYRQNSDIILIHDILLRDLGYRWDMIGNLPDDWLKSKAADAAREKIVDFIDSEFDGSTFWAISDPRLCKFLPLWLDVFSEKKLSPGIALMLRHPYEVAASLQNRHGIDLLKGHLLWLASNRQALAELRQHKHTIVTYDRLLADPVSCVEAIAHELHLDFPISLTGACQDIISYIRPERQHEQNSQAVSSQKRKNAFAHYAWFYDQFRKHQNRLSAFLLEDRDSSEPSDTAETSVQNLAVFPLLAKAAKNQRTSVDTSYVSEMFDNLLSLIGSHEQVELDPEINRQKQLEEISKEYEQSRIQWEETRAELQQILSENETFIQKWQARKEQLKQEKQNLEEKLSEKKAQLQENEGYKNQLERQIQELKDTLVSQEDLTRQYFTELSHLENKVQEKDSIINELEKKTSELEAEKHKLAQELEEKAREAKNQAARVKQVKDKLAFQEDLTRQYFTELSKSETQLVAVQERAEAAESQNRETSKLINQVRKDHAALVSSLRWRWGNRLVRFIEILMFRKKQPLAVDHMQEVLARFDKAGEKQHKTAQSFAPRSHTASGTFYGEDDIKILNSWLRQLQNDHKLLKGSARWKLGNAIIRTIELLTFKHRQTMAIDHMEQIFRQYQEQSADYPVQNTKKLQSWLRQAKNDFYALKKSMRWRTGNRLFSIIDTLLLRWKKQTAMDHALKIAADYEKWEKNH